MSLTHTSFTEQLANLMPIGSSDANFLVMLPGAIDYVEGALYRELDLLSVRVTDTSVTCTSGTRTILLSTTQGTMLVVDRVNIMTPAGATSSLSRNTTLPVSPDWMDNVFGSALSSNTGMPAFFSRTNDTQITLGPAPDAAYGTEIVATVRPNPLSSGNSSNWFTQNTPELYLAGAAVFAFGWMRDFGQSASDPQAGQSWQARYQELLQSAKVDELRMKFQSNAWSNQIPSPTATPPRV